MTLTTRAFSRAVALTLGIALLGLFSSVASAASISYGNFGPVPPATSFLAVSESSGTDPVPLYGPPTPFATGLDFDPAGFVAVSTGGVNDITDGQLNFTIMAPIINSVNLVEAGDYTLTGVGTPATQVFAGAIMRATVTQINGVDVAPIALPSVNGSVGFNLIASPGFVSPWSLGLGIDVASQMAAMGLGNASKVEIVINNQLIALSEPASIAFIAKKDFRITTDTDPIPEPGAMALAGMALCGLGVSASRRRG